MLFSGHNVIQDYDTQPYFPLVDQIGSVILYHGVQTTAWTSFVTHGISPPYTANEFSSAIAFNVSSHLEVAFEHPLHNHPQLYTGDLVSILVFKVPLDILHGLTAPLDGGPFVCRWFERNDKAWSSFYLQNLWSKGAFFFHHSFDIH